MEWIGRTVCEIFSLKLYCDLETRVRVTQGHRKRYYSIEHIQLYIRLPYTCIYYYFQDIAAYWSKIATIVFGAPVRGEAVRFTQQPLVTKNENDGPIRE